MKIKGRVFTGLGKARFFMDMNEYEKRIKEIGEKMKQVQRTLFS